MFVFDPAVHAPRVETPGNPWVEETDMMDSIALLLSGKARRCATCRRPARLKHLQRDLCPDCRTKGESA